MNEFVSHSFGLFGVSLLGRKNAFELMTREKKYINIKLKKAVHICCNIKWFFI